MTYTTLKYGGTEKQLADWGIDNDSPEITFVVTGVDTLSVSVPGRKIDDDPLFAFEGAVEFRIGRVSASGLPNSFSGGALEFSGKRTLNVLDGRPDYEGVTYQFGGPWYDIDKTCYQQTIKVWSGTGTTTTDVNYSELALFYDATTNLYLNTGAQITDALQSVLDWYSAQSLAAPFQIGTIEPAVGVPTYQVKDIMCSEAIQTCLRSSPDASVWFDYSTSPPTANVTKRASMTPVSLAIANSTHKSIHLTPRPDLQMRAVVIYFKITGTDNQRVWVQRLKRKWGPDKIAAALTDDGDASVDTDVEGGLRVLVQSIDLQGAQRTVVTGHLDVIAATPNDASGATAIKTWWQRRKDVLTNARLRNLSFNVFNDCVIKDKDGNVLSTATTLSNYPNEIVGGTWAPWMTLSGGAAVNVIEVTITTDALWEEWSEPDDGTTHTNGILLHKLKRRVLSCKVKLTNGVTGNYSAVDSFASGEPVPVNLAKNIYESLSELQYEGTDVRVEGENTQYITLGNTLNLTGGRSEWTTMNSQIQSIRKSYGKGTTEVDIGPARFLGAGDLTQLFLFNRFRYIWHNPLTRNSALSSDSSSVAIPEETQLENTSEGVEDKKVFAYYDLY